jgi:hypothetical protein
MVYTIGILNFNAYAGRWVWDEDRAIHSKTSESVAEVDYNHLNPNAVTNCSLFSLWLDQMMGSTIRSLPIQTQTLLKLGFHPTDPFLISHIDHSFYCIMIL